MIENLSHSSLESWLTCGEKFRLQKVERVPRRPMWAAVGGSAVHAATEGLDLADFGIEPEDAVYNFQDAFEREIVETEEKYGFPRSEWIATGRATKEWPNKQDYEWWSAAGQAMVDAWRNFLRNSPWQIAILDGVPAIELSFECTIGGKPVRGYVDRIVEEIRRPDVKAVVDLKSGSMEPKSGYQLGAYSVAVKRALGLDVDWGFFFMNRKASTTAPVDLRPFHDGRLDLYYERVWKAIEAGVFIPVPGNLCGSCGVREYCREMGGEKAEEVRDYKIVA